MRSHSGTLICSFASLPVRLLCERRLTNKHWRTLSTGRPIWRPGEMSVIGRAGQCFPLCRLTPMSSVVLLPKGGHSFLVHCFAHCNRLMPIALLCSTRTLCRPWPGASWSYKCKSNVRLENDLCESAATRVFDMLKGFDWASPGGMQVAQQVTSNAKSEEKTTKIR